MPEKVNSGICCKTKCLGRPIDTTACPLCDGHSVQRSLVDLPHDQIEPSLATYAVVSDPDHVIANSITEHVEGSNMESKTKEENRELVQVTGAPPLDSGLEHGYAIPDNFALVWDGVYRSSFPKEESFEFIRRLGLKSILTLFPEEYPAKNIKFMEETGIHHFQIGMPGNKEPFVNIPKDGVCAALKTVLDRQNHPILIHCNKGKHRTGCVVGCVRKLQKWGLTLIFDEYRRHSHPKSRALDQQFIELFDDDGVTEVARKNGWLPKHHDED